MPDDEETCPANSLVEDSGDGEWVDPPPECPYNCPYDPMNPQRPEYVDEVVESDIVAKRPDVRTVDTDETQNDSNMTTIVRKTSSQADVHFQNVWQTKWETKVGVLSKPEFSDMFSEEIEWEIAHQKWNTDRVKDTDMWELDASAVYYVVSKFADDGVDVTVSDEVHEAYLSAVEEDA